MDPSVFFSLLFGSERFEPWIGELYLDIPWPTASALALALALAPPCYYMFLFSCSVASCLGNWPCKQGSWPRPWREVPCVYQWKSAWVRQSLSQLGGLQLEGSWLTGIKGAWRLSRVGPAARFRWPRPRGRVFGTRGPSFAGHFRLQIARVEKRTCFFISMWAHESHVTCRIFVAGLFGSLPCCNVVHSKWRWWVTTAKSWNNGSCIERPLSANRNSERLEKCYAMVRLLADLNVNVILQSDLSDNVRKLMEVKALWIWPQWINYQSVAGALRSSPARVHERQCVQAAAAAGLIRDASATQSAAVGRRLSWGLRLASCNIITTNCNYSTIVMSEHFNLVILQQV